MSKHGKNGKKAKKARIPKKKKIKDPKAQGLFERIISNEKEGLGLSTKRKEQGPPRVTKLYLMFSRKKKHKR